MARRFLKFEREYLEQVRLREAAEKRVAELEAKLSEYEEDRTYLAERCAECGHRFAYASNFCAQCQAEVGPDEPEAYPDHCPCPRCFAARKAAPRAAAGEETAP